MTSKFTEVVKVMEMRLKNEKSSQTWKLSNTIMLKLLLWVCDALLELLENPGCGLRIRWQTCMGVISWFFFGHILVILEVIHSCRNYPLVNYKRKRHLVSSSVSRADKNVFIFFSSQLFPKCIGISISLKRRKRQFLLLWIFLS